MKVWKGWDFSTVFSNGCYGPPGEPFAVRSFSGVHFCHGVFFSDRRHPSKTSGRKMHKPKHGDPRSEYMFQSARGVEITYIDFKFGIDRSNNHFHGHPSIPWNASLPTTKWPRFIGFLQMLVTRKYMPGSRS